MLEKFFGDFEVSKHLIFPSDLQNRHELDCFMKGDFVNKIYEETGTDFLSMEVFIDDVEVSFCFILNQFNALFR